MNDKSVTFILLSHNRPHKLERCLEYIDSCNVWDKYNFVLLDSSKKEMKGSIIDIFNKYPFLEFIKMFDEDINVYDKVNAILKHINTPYVMMCADDDFVIFDEIPYLIDNLRNIYSSTIGENISFKILKGEYFTYWNNSYFYDIEKPTSYSRKEMFKKSYFPLFYALIKTDVFKDAIEYACCAEKDNTIREVAFSSMVISKGMFKAYNWVTHVRELDENSDSNKTTTKYKEGVFSKLSYFLREKKIPIEYIIYPLLQCNWNELNKIRDLVVKHG